MKVIDRTKAVTLSFLEKSLKKLSKNIRKIHTFCSEWLLRLGVLRVFVLFCVFKRDMTTLFTTVFF